MVSLAGCCSCILYGCYQQPLPYKYAYNIIVLDDMLTPCDDEDPVAAIATAPLIGENDGSMMTLPLLNCNKTAVS